jgi:6-phosphogluconolactonase
LPSLPLLNVQPDAEAVARAAAGALERAIISSPAGAPFHLALAGGTTPRRVYALLAARPLPWSRVQIWFGDERCVAPDHADSNYAMARAALLEPAKVPAANVHRMKGELADFDAAARAYERELPQRLDLLLLGIGPDGHTASLFPGAGALRERERRVVAVTGPKPPPNRLTITPPAVAAAARVVVLATGAEKRGAVHCALTTLTDPFECPARLLCNADWYVDRAAAG